MALTRWPHLSAGEREGWSAGPRPKKEGEGSAGLGPAGRKQERRVKDKWVVLFCPTCFQQHLQN